MATAEQLAQQQAAAMAMQHNEHNAGDIAAAMNEHAAGASHPATNPASPAPASRPSAGHNAAEPGGFGQQVADALGFNAMFKDPNEGRFEREQAGADPAQQPHKLRSEMDKKFDAEAADEHSWGHVSLCANPEQMLMEHGLGQGVMWYFKFGQFIIWYNLILCLVALISFIPSVVTGPEWDGAATRFPGVFYLSTYPASVYPAFVLCVTIMLICTFGLGPAYRYYVIQWIRKQREARDKAAAGGQDVKWIEDEFEGRYGREQFDYVDDTAVDRIEYDFEITTRYSRCGVFQSTVIMALILGASGVITFYMQRATRQAGGNSVASFCIALFVSFMAYLWEYICNILTRLEYWAYWSDYWKSTCIKVLLFKILNIFTVFLVKRIEFQSDNADGACQLEDLANQFLLLIALNTLATVANLLYVLVFTSPDDERSVDGYREFILSQEYVELVYRMFLLHLGFLVAPMIVIFGLLANLMEYWIDKYRLLRVCHKPKVTSSTFRGVLAFYFFLSALFVLASFPNGAIFILDGSFGLSGDETCFIYQGK
uniref:Anoctamin transmembrane domain-containing protein n=2 Tax=Lotharella globosa TaxID=91324 RepID=A0A7S3YPN1_9EUKA|mmetsp:Transcript_9075/g.17756  ORF Transcript_9075/g.17756 Transcript_9075/m.17756 type:complete len:542 (-) Transcript_9075:403-2028(-)